MDRYIGLDVHASSCTLAVVGPSGKRHGCEGLSDCDAEPTNAPTPSRRTGNSKLADACGKNMGRRRVY